jgi:sec-independent protein translocase protein TatB
MFDIGFSELVVIAVVALIVIGPERLPKAARTMGHLFGRLQRYVSDVKSDINREMELEELRKLQQQVQGAAREVESQLAEPAAELPPLAEPVAEPAETAHAAASAEPPRQARLPGFDPL